MTGIDGSHMHMKVELGGLNIQHTPIGSSSEWRLLLPSYHIEAVIYVMCSSLHVSESASALQE